MKATYDTISWTFEELGINEGKSIDVDITIRIEPGEKQTWDYPGSDPYVEWTDVKVVTWGNDTDVFIKPSNGWEPTLQYLAEELVSEHFDSIMEHQD